MEENYTQVYERPSKSFAGFIDILESFIYAIVVVVLVFTFLGRLSIVDGSSMDNTLSHGEYLVVADPFFLYQPKQGDIVIIDGGEAFTPYTEPIVKRVIATEGQTITIDTKAECVYVDGVMLEEEYAVENALYICYASPNEKVKNSAYYKEELGEDYYSVLYDLPEQYSNEDGSVNSAIVQPFNNLDAATKQILNNLWSKLK